MAKERLAKRTQRLEEWWQHPNALLLLIGNVYRVSIRKSCKWSWRCHPSFPPPVWWNLLFYLLLTFICFFIFPGKVVAFTNDGFLNISTVFHSFKNCNDITKNWQKTGDNSILIDIIITELYVELFSYKIQRINF